MRDKLPKKREMKREIPKKREGLKRDEMPKRAKEADVEMQKDDTISLTFSLSFDLL